MGQFRCANGAWGGNSCREVASAEEVMTAVARYLRQPIPLGYFVGTAEREANFATNLWYVEPGNTPDTYGIFQVRDNSDENPNGYDLLTLDGCAAAFVPLVERNYVALVQAVQARGDALTTDIWAYLGIAHNQGLAAAIKTIQNYGLTWERYKRDNADIIGDGKPLNHIDAYGDTILRAVAYGPAAGALAFSGGLSKGRVAILAGMALAVGLWVTIVAKKRGL